MSTFKERNEAWERIDELVNMYVCNMVDIALLRRELENTEKEEEYFEVLELAFKGAIDNYYTGLESASNTIDSCGMGAYLIFLNWIKNHQDLIEEKDSKDGKYKEVYFKRDGSLMYKIDMGK